MSQSDGGLSIEQQRLQLEQARLRLESSFARKWFPTLATFVVGFVAAVFGYVQQQNAREATKQAQIQADYRARQALDEARQKDEREWGFKIVEMYFDKRELFDFTRNADQAQANLRVLSAVAPAAVQGVLNVEQGRIPAPGTDGEGGDARRLESLAAVAQVQSAIQRAQGEQPASSQDMQPGDFLVYIQYPNASKDAAAKAQQVLQRLGYRAPAIESVRNPPSRLQVRYYRVEQKQLAGSLAIELGTALGLPATADNAVQVVSRKPLPSGILELWLPQA